MEQKLYGGIELGGTKTICAIADSNGTITAQTTIPTTTVDETLSGIFEFFEQNEPIASLGVGAFGPLQLNPASAEFGYIYNAPKPGWLKVDIKGLLENQLKLPVHLDTDVNCAALGEHYFGVAKQAQNFVYLTLGTGIGGSLMHDGKLVHGLRNLEMGHMRVPHEPFTDSFKGACAFHNDCLEGIASGYALEHRYGQKAEEINNPDAWEMEANYIAAALHNLMMTMGPELIVLGGGLAKHPGLVEAIRTKVQDNVNHYLEFPDLENYIVHSSGEMNGVLGAIKLTSLAD